MSIVTISGKILAKNFQQIMTKNENKDSYIGYLPTYYRKKINKLRNRKKLTNKEIAKN
jgi:hypothetical protein